MIQYIDGVPRQMSAPEIAAFEATRPVPPPALVRTYKSDIWRRCTDAEAATLDAALNAAPVRMRRLWSDSTILEHENPDFTGLRVQMVAAFGEVRTAEILAAS